MAITSCLHVSDYLITQASMDMTQIRKRADEYGYLFLPKFLPVADVLQVRNDVLKVCAQHNWITANKQQLSSRPNPKQQPVVESNTLEWVDYYVTVQQQRSLAALNCHPKSLEWLSDFFSEPALAHPRFISRTIFPQNIRHTTPPHQDYHYINGTTDTWTMWICLGDCDAELGGLMIAPKTHTVGKLPVEKAEGAGGKQVHIHENTQWHWNPLHAGDVLLLHSHTIHQGKDNIGQHLRLSADFRYQPASHVITKNSILPHMRWQSWEDIYQTWNTGPDDPLKYYWKDFNLDVI